MSKTSLLSQDRQASADRWSSLPTGWGADTQRPLPPVPPGGGESTSTLSKPRTSRGGLSTPSHASVSNTSTPTSSLKRGTKMAEHNLPSKGWDAVKIHSETFYLNLRFLVAQRVHPGVDGSGACKRVSNTMLQRPRKGMPILYVIMPQPHDIPDPFESCICVPAEKTGTDCKLVYYNTADQSMHDTNPLYTGFHIMSQWDEMVNDEGGKYFLNLNTGLTTYDDPRVVKTPKASSILSKKHAKAEGFDRKKSMKVSRKQTWKIEELDPKAFEALDWCLTDEHDIPETVRNKTYNRYMDILPNPLTRVPLRMRGNDASSAYIHANWIRGPNGEPKYYIGAQGPTKSTVNQFWRMIWQTKPSVIVMVTGLMEHGVQKCERYWPGLADGKLTLKFDRIIVMTMKSKPANGYVHSTIKAVGDTPDGKNRMSHTIEHFWYNTWPDHGVPRKKNKPLYTEPTLAMIKAVHLVTVKKKKQPVLVHCSAGIGRTGTYIALDHCLSDLNQNNKCNLLNTIASIRKDRCAMVQHLNQYKFVQAAIIDAAESMNHPFEVVGQPSSSTSAINEDEVVEENDDDNDSSNDNSSDNDDNNDFDNDNNNDDDNAFGNDDDERGGAQERLPRPPSVQSNNSDSLGVINYEGESYQYLDVDGLGMMQEQEAIDSGMPRSLIDELDPDGDGFITASSWKQYQRDDLIDFLKN